MKFAREIKIGLTFVVAIALFIWGFNFLKGRNIFKRESVYYAVFQSVNGLVGSSPVYINGLKVGLVKDIYFRQDGSNHVIVSISIPPAITIPKNSIIIIYSADLMGSKAINLKLGNSQSLANPGDTLTSETQSTFTEDINKQVLPFKNKAEALMGSMDSAITIIRYIFNEKTRDNLERSFESIRTIIENIEKTSYHIDTLVSTQRNRLTLILGNIESITSNLKNNNQKISNIVTHFSELSDTLAKVKISETILHLNQSLSKVSGIIDKVDKGEGSLGLLINDKKLYNELESSSNELRLLIEDMRLHPDRYVHFSVFGRKPTPAQKESNKP